jgi:2,4-dienoyl-CoA reductase (NADPH2)
LADRGHEVHLFESASEIGGQFNMAKRIPGKEEFSETLRYFARRIVITGVQLHLSRRVAAAELIAQQFDAVVLASGVRPRDPKIPGADGANVLSYIDVLLHAAAVGSRVAIIGAGGIGFDVAEYLVTAPGRSPTMNLHEWLVEWGVADPASVRGGVVRAQPAPPARQVTLLQRKAGKLGKGLGKTTGWIHRAALQMKQVEMIGGVNYERITPQGLFVTYGEKHSDGQLIECDTVVLCAGQEPLRDLLAPLQAAGMKTHLIGGADEAAELDAKRAIDQGTRLAAVI